MKPKSKLFKDMADTVGKTIAKLQEDPHDCGCMAVKAKDTKPDFKANPKLGEGYPNKDELRYRQSLIDELKIFHDGINDLLNTDTDETVKQEALKTLRDNYISNSKKLARDELIKAYDNGVNQLITDLKKIDITVDESNLEEEALKKLIEYQEVAIEKTGMNLYYTFKDYLKRVEVWQNPV